MAQGLLTQVFGLRDNAALSVAQQALSAATTRLMFGFVQQEAKTLNKVRVFLTAVSGTLGASDMVCALHPMPSGLQAASTVPSAATETSSAVTATPTGSQWVEFTGFTTPLTAGSFYALVIRNANGTPASNNFTIRWVTGNSDYVLGSSGALGWLKKVSTDGGSSYGGTVPAVGGLRLEFSDGSFIGVPVSNGSAMVVGDGVYSTRESGAKFTTPADAKIRAFGIGARIVVTGSPTGSPRYRIYNDTTLVATTESGTHYASTQYLALPFSSSVILDASTTYRIVLSETTQSDTAGNRFGLYEYTVDDDANSKALMPFGGWVKTYYDGSSWTDTDTSSPPIYLFGDSDDLFDSTGGGVGSAGGAPVLGGGVVR